MMIRMVVKPVELAYLEFINMIENEAKKNGK
jgi:hypothetical protein